MDLVTIILTTLNSEKYVARSIESCLNQTYHQLELLVVDGGSTDRTLEIVASYHDPRVRVVPQPQNSGKLPGAINLGMANARGAYITWTQDDCWYELNAIDIMAKYLAVHPDVALVYTDYWDIDHRGQRIRYQHVNTPDHMLEDDVIRQCFLFRRIVYETIGPQDVKYYSVHEVPWRIKIAKRFKIAPLHIPLQDYMLHAESLTGQFGGWTEQRKMTRALFQEGYFDQRSLNKRLVKIDVDQAYDEFLQKGNYAGFRQFVWSGVRRDPQWLRNIGLMKLIAISLLPGRGRRRSTMYTRWKAETDAQQAELIRTYASGMTKAV